ncbi:MAG: hypothetical protein CRN43_09080 [Candidatus Nephrothrix sp. EaCA]|nr:MAG: hypothetical protein CRN43_09080 [Candidatus Nephrothrix sp. EaCA]
MKYYLKALRNFANFSGRARRKEYWYFVLFSFIFGLGIIIILRIALEMNGDILAILFLLYALATFIPGLAVTVRRLHDVGKSGSFLFILLIPLIGLFFLPVLIVVLIVVIWFLVLMLTDSNSGENEYGENPKEVAV